MLTKHKIEALVTTSKLDITTIGIANLSCDKTYQAMPDSFRFRHDPQYHLEGAKTAIVVLMPYDIVISRPQNGFGRIASIGYHADYHKVLTEKLETLATRISSVYGKFNYKTFVDKDGLNDGEIAIMAGLGHRAKNALIINNIMGTAHNIGYLLTDLVVESADLPQLDTDLCKDCSLCENACPVGALKDRRIDASICRSAINQSKGVIYLQHQKNMADWLYGCDICQVVCPHNKVVKVSDAHINLDDIMSLTKGTFKLHHQRQSYGYLGQTKLKRNAMIILSRQWGIDYLANYKDIIARSELLINQYHQLGGIMSNLHELPFLQENIQALKDNGTYRKLPVLNGPCEAVCMLNGKEVINLSSNNYLGLATHPRLKKAAIEAVEKYGVGAGAVRTIVGNMDIHEQLEQKLAEFKREEAVMVYQSGFNCNAGTIQAITDKGDLIISDELNHASIIDGVRLSKAARAVYKHSDMADLKRVLEENKGKYKTTLIITDGVFSMDGDIAKLPEIVELAEQYGALTYVDDAHGSGVLGENGRGTVDHFGLHGRVDFIIGTLSKAIGVIGGYVAGKKVTQEWLSHRGRPILFSTALPPAAVGAIIESVDMLMNDSQYTDRLWANAKFFKEKLSKLGFNTGHSETPITPVIIGDEAKTLEFSKALLDNGVYVSGIVFPTVPKGTGRVRCMVSAGHTEEQLSKAVDIFEKVGKEMGIIS